MKRKRSEVPWRRNWWNGFGRRNARPRISSGRATNKRPPGCGRPERKRPQSRRDEGLRSARAEGEAIRRAAEEEAASACRELTERAIARRDAVIRLAAERLLADDA